MVQLLVVADDFTGALDTGVQFSNYQAKTLVTTDLESLSNKQLNTIDVLVIDTESRYLSPQQAYQRLSELFIKAQQLQIPYVFNKVDSALRGNVSHEIKAMTDVYKDHVIPFVPAYPEMKRTVQQGYLYIDQQLVSKSVFADDPYEPVKESDIIKRLRLEADVKTVLVQAPEQNIDDAGVYLFDTQTEEELHDIYDVLELSNHLTYSVGCAGGAKVLAKKLFKEKRTNMTSLKLPLVVICGSVNPITKAQITDAQQKGYPRFSLSGNQLLTPSYWETSTGARDIELFEHSIHKYPLIQFETHSSKTNIELNRLKHTHHLTDANVRSMIGLSLGELTKKLWEQNNIGTYLFTGGDTLYQAMQVLEVDEIRPICELSPGVVLSQLQWKGQLIDVITKSGGFGPPTLFEEFVALGQRKED